MRYTTPLFSRVSLSTQENFKKYCEKNASSPSQMIRYMVEKKLSEEGMLEKDPSSKVITS